MSRMNPEARPEAEDCIRMMRFMAKSVKADRKTIERCVNAYKKLYPDWESEPEKEHYFFYDIGFIQDAIYDYSHWLETAGNDWEDKIRGSERS